MDRRTFLRTTSTSGLLITAAPLVLEQYPHGAEKSPQPNSDTTDDPYADFFSLPIYRAYVRGVQFHDLPEYYIDDLKAPQALDLVKEPDNRHDKRAVAVYHDGLKLGYLPREDNLVLGKLVRRGLPVRCQLIGVQPDEESYRQLSIEVSLLYPPHHTSDDNILQAEEDRKNGLQYVKKKPQHKLHESGDPLSMHHVWDGYFG